MLVGIAKCLGENLVENHLSRCNKPTSPLHKPGNWGSKRVTKLPKSTGLMRDGGKTWVQPPDFSWCCHTTTLPAGCWTPRELTRGNQDKDTASTQIGWAHGKGGLRADKGVTEESRTGGFQGVPGALGRLGRPERWFGPSRLRLCSQSVVFTPPSI